MKLAWLPVGVDIDRRYCLFLIREDGVKIKIKDPKYDEDSTMTELKPCKCYCKSFEMIDLPSGKKMIRCHNCWRTSAACDTEQQAIDAWNKRS